MHAKLKCSNDVIRDTAARLGGGDVHLVDVAEKLAAADRGGVCGARYFPDPCHPNFNGHSRIAEYMARQASEFLPAWVKRDAQGVAPLKTSDFARFLGRHTAGYANYLGRLLKSDFIRSKYLRERIVSARDQAVKAAHKMTPEARIPALESAIERCGPCAMLLLELGAEWLGRDKQQEALACAEEAYARYPYS